MENLVGRKVLCTQSFRGITRDKKYEIVKCNEETFTIVEDNGCEQPWSRWHLDSETHFKLIIDEWLPKQGDKVLWTDDFEEWQDGIFLVEYDRSYIIEADEMLVYGAKIKPYEEEIKVGDWVKRVNDKTIWLIENEEDVDLVKRTDCQIITNPQLIELLDKEL